MPECKNTIEDVRRTGLSLGFELLSTDYHSSKKLLLWKCQRGHTFNQTFYRIRTIQNCSVCSGTVKKTIEQVAAAGKAVDLTLLTTSYLNSQTVMDWKCSKGHICRKHYNSVQQGQGCRTCAGLVPLSLDLAKQIAVQRSGQCKSTEYNNCDSPLVWECNLRHTWLASLYSIKNNGSWCPVCAKRYDKAQTELYLFVKEILPNVEILQNAKALISPKLELDIYIPSMRKAIELDGERWHSDPKVQERDARKDRECQEVGIALLRLPYTSTWAKYTKNTVGKPMVKNWLYDR